MRRIAIFAALFLGLLGLVACQEEGLVSSENIFVSSEFRAQCDATAGVLVHGQEGTVLCAEPTPDAGKTCRYSGECSGLCITSTTQPQATTGQCQPAKPFSGCYTMVNLVEENRNVCIEG
ncbi:hypothetical protein [Chachezhania antarctica]|mgnify:CR=1 FL=1|uniref:hypothetical protein n=1 Tax=Chachezhania antarctica TaxID=2340860 RepID=UPI000EAE6EDD|nr:hypothetical protein [Chachezhania antarctica]|tara:strand:+ start:843 stop:1202 length:360 start_codon:yes stop_codon:yes gene_type:complete